MKTETHKRSIVRSIIWRILGVIVLATVTFIITRNWIQTGLVTVIHHGMFLVIYYLHERGWQKITRFDGCFWSVSCLGHSLCISKRKILRMLTYEIVLGHLVLGTITWLVTGSWLSVSLVTIIYIENKLWIYYVYDWIWDKISWGIELEKVCNEQI